MAIADKGVKGKETFHVVFLNFERGLNFRGLSFRDTRCRLQHRPHVVRIQA